MGTGLKNMVKTNKDITEKNYKKLSIQVTLDGLSFCCQDMLSNNVTDLHTVAFEELNQVENTKQRIATIFINNQILTNRYDEIVVIYQNNISTFVPKAFFDKTLLNSYLQFNNRIFESDTIVFDYLKDYEMYNVYVPDVFIQDFLKHQLDSYQTKHASSILVEKLLDISKNDENKKMYVHVCTKHFEIVVIQNQQLLLYNTFEYSTPIDFLYYLLFTAEQLQLNPEHFELLLLGDINTENEVYKMAYKYVRNTQLLDFTPWTQHNKFTAPENRKHFILLQS
jgi:hypothetical protein